jgi:hypothetical protein
MYLRQIKCASGNSKKNALWPQAKCVEIPIPSTWNRSFPMTFQSSNHVLYPSRGLLVGAALTLLASSGVWAQALAPSDKPMTTKEISDTFAKADANKDGKLDMKEAETVPGLAARFDMADADGDKMISKAEFEKAMKQ